MPVIELVVLAVLLEAIFGCLVHETNESSSSTHKVLAQRLLTELSHHSGLVIAGLVLPQVFKLAS
jgi:hypothetical protein